MPTAVQCRSRDLRAGITARPPKPVSLALIIGLLLSCSHHRDPAAAFNHARQSYRHGDIAAAEREADEAYKDFHATSPYWAWQFIILRARVLYRKGMDDAALKLLESAPGAPPSVELAVQRLRLESDSYAHLDQFPAAELKLAEAERLCLSSVCSACGDLASARGMLEMDRAHYSQAQVLFEQALGSAHTHNDQFLEAIALLNLSWSADSQTRFDEALDWANSARKIAVPSDFAGIAQAALGNMGWAYYKLGDREKARQMFIEADRQAAKLADVGDQINWVTAAGYTYMDDGDLREAERLFHQSLDLALRINSHEDIMDSRTALAFVSEQAGNIDDAKRYADEALAMARAGSIELDILYPSLIEGRVAARRNDASTAESNFREVAKSTDAPVFLKWEAERSLARLYENEKPDSADGEYRTALSTFEAARCSLRERVDSRLPFLTNAARIYEDYIHFLVTHGKTNEALQVADYTRARTLAEGLGRPCKSTFALDPLNAPELARRAGGTILFYALGQEHSYLWAVTAHEVRIFPLAANQSEIDAAVESYRKKLVGRPEILENSNDGGVLYQMLVRPARDLLNKEMLAKNGNVFIIPDGGLNSLNFETLLPQPKHYWIEDVTIANAASLRLLPASRSHGWKLNGKLLLMGNPVAPDAGSDNPYPELPNAAAQTENIEKYFTSERQRDFTREQAIPAAYLNSHPEQYSYIHFVAHGTASRMSPLDSAIILSKDPASSAAAGDHSFKLYARDIIQQNNINHHNPLRTELVTISSCNSVGNRTYSGEGLVGLSWAFLDAGAHNVIGALWEVSDASTATFMDRLYGEMKRGQPPDAAMRSAKLSLLHSEDSVRRPFYWAPFQLYRGR